MNLRSVDLNLLVAFDALLSERQVTRAALRIGISQPAMSSTLARLRATFEDELLVRTPSGMEPTPLATELLVPIKRILRDIERVLDNRHSFEPSSSRKTFRVRMGDLHDVLILPHILSRLEREAPGISLEVSHLPPAQSIVALENDDLDFAISTGLHHPTTIRSQTLYRDRLICVYREGHPLARNPMSLENFLELRHVKIAQSPTDTRFIDDELAQQQKVRKIALHVQHWLGAPDIVRSTDLVSAMWERMAHRFNSGGGLVMCPLPFGPAQFSFSVYWHHRYDGHAPHCWLRTVFADVERTLAKKT